MKLLFLNQSEIEELTLSYLNPSTNMQTFISKEIGYNNLILFSKQYHIEISIAINEYSSIIKQEEININKELLQIPFAQNKNNSWKKSLYQKT